MNEERPDHRLYEHIYGRAGLTQALADLSELWVIRSFADIPMGWSAELVLHEIRVLLSSERGDIAAMSFVGDERFDPPSLPDQANRSNCEIVRLFLESVHSHWKERNAP
ncbi:MAG: hypothetical protein ABIT76_10090 [Chthoniobacterales bacterium]